MAASLTPAQPARSSTRPAPHLTMQSPDSVSLIGALTNQGTIDQAGAAPLVLEGTIDNEVGATYSFLTGFGLTSFLNAVDAFTNSGTIDVDAGGTVDLVTSLSNTGGTIEVQSGTLVWSGSDGVSTGGTFLVATGATMQYSGSSSGNILTGDYTGSGGGDVVVAAGNLSIGSSGATFDFPDGFFQWQPGGNIIATAGTLFNSGFMTATSGPTGNALLSGTVENAGTITLEGSGNFVGGTIDNDTGGLLDVQGVDSAEYPFVFATINNAGTIQRSASTGAAGIWSLNNASNGVINVESGTLISWVQSGVNSGGTFDVATGATLKFGASATFTGSYTGSGGGQFLVGPGKLSIGPAVRPLISPQASSSGNPVRTLPRRPVI